MMDCGGDERKREGNDERDGESNRYEGWVRCVAEVDEGLRAKGRETIGRIKREERVGKGVERKKYASAEELKESDVGGEKGWERKCRKNEDYVGEQG